MGISPNIVTSKPRKIIKTEPVKLNKKNKPYEKVKNLIGSVSSGIPDLGEAHRKHLTCFHHRNHKS